MRYRTMLLILASIAGSGCAWQGTPVPVTGDLSGLAGEWEGMYSSAETGRSGTISFKLDAVTDSAFGDVWMEPAQPQEMGRHDAPRGAVIRPPGARVLRIAFVRSERGRVTGRLEVYQDPVTGAPLSTVFEGRQRRNEFTGTYSTLIEGTGKVVTGEWSVRRMKR